MTSFIEYPIETDPDALLQDFIAELQSYWPNYVPNEGSLAFRAASALIRMIAESREVASLIPREVFRVLGTELHGIPTDDALPATADVTMTARDNAGYGPMPAGTLLSLEGQFFETLDDVTWPSGTTVVNPVAIIATENGAASNNLGAPGDPVSLEEPFEYVASITLNATTSGGQDLEPLETYLDRLRERLTLLSPRAITTQDLATLARSVTGVERALALKGYDPVAGTFGHEGVASVALVDAVGQPVPLATKDAVEALLLGPGDRLINSVIHMIDATYTAVDVTWEGVAYPSADLATVEAEGNAAVAALLDPNMHGQPLGGDERLWYQKAIISLYDVAGALDQIPGLDRVTLIEIGLAGGAQTAADHNLPGVAPLPTAGVLDGTVTLP